MLTTLSSDQKQELRDAKRRARKVRRASRVASMSGWTMGFFGALSLLFGLGDIASMVLGASMCVLAWVELGGASQIREFRSQACTRLALNQIAFMLLIMAYCGWSMAHVHADPELAEVSAMLDSDVSQAMVDLTRFVYMVGIVGAFFFQGGLAAYYFTRRRPIEFYLNRTPPWVVEVQRAA